LGKDKLLAAGRFITQTESKFLIEYADAGQGSVVVLLHAFPLSREMWRPQIEALRDQYRVIAPDLRGFGGTPEFARTPFIEQMADDVSVLLDSLDINEPVTIGGLSMGGYVALAFAHKHPHRLRALILSATRAEADSDEAKAKRQQMIEFARQHSARVVVEKMLPNLLCEGTRANRPEVVEEVVRMGSAQSRGGIVAALQAMRDRPDARPWLSSIRVPVLLVFGAQDALAPPEIIQTLQNGIPRAQLATIRNAGHLSNMEQPQLFSEAVRSFLHSLI
jgi:3-oxoadipate enol-lactonase